MDSDILQSMCLSDIEFDDLCEGIVSFEDLCYADRIDDISVIEHIKKDDDIQQMDLVQT